MKFTRIIGRKELIQAAIFGSLAGVVGVIFFIFMLNSMNNEDVQEVAEQGEEEVVPVSSDGESSTPSVDLSALQFYANQHGVFSSFEGATDFMAGYSSLNTATIIEVDGSYFVWSEVTPVQEGIVKSENPPSFAKAFKVSSSACQDPTIQNVPTLLSSEDRGKFYFEQGQAPENLPQDWQSITSAMASLSDDLDVTRLHLLKHYFEQNECLKIQF